MKERLARLLTPAAKYLGFVPDAETVALKGHVWADQYEAGKLVATHALGRNVLTDAMRINVACLLARTNAETGVPYLGDSGYVATDPVFPVELGVGLGTTPALRTDTNLATPVHKGAAPARYPLVAIDTHRTLSGFGTSPIGCTFVFDIPAGEVFDEGATLTLQELALWDGQGTPVMLARKVSALSYGPTTSYVIRWRIST